jgi:hypothetical protein
MTDLPFGAFADGVSPRKLADEVFASMDLGVSAPTDQVTARFGHALGINPHDRAAVSAAWTQFCAIGHVSSDRRVSRRLAPGDETYEFRILHGQLVSYDLPVSDEPTFHAADAMTVADRRAYEGLVANALTPHQVAAVRRIVAQELQRSPDEEIR